MLDVVTVSVRLVDQGCQGRPVGLVEQRRVQTLCQRSPATFGRLLSRAGKTVTNVAGVRQLLVRGGAWVPIPRIDGGQQMGPDVIDVPAGAGGEVVNGVSPILR